MLFPTTLVGSYPQPDWLIDRAKLAGRFPPRVRARELWRVPEPFLAEAQDDATLVAIRAQEEAGLDIVGSGPGCGNAWLSNPACTRHFGHRPASASAESWMPHFGQRVDSLIAAFSL